MEMTDNDFREEVDRVWKRGYETAEKDYKPKLEATILENEELKEQLRREKIAYLSLARSFEAIKDEPLKFEEARKIIEEVSHSPELKKWFYHGKEQDPCGVHAFTAKYKQKPPPAPHGQPGHDHLDCM